ncbi:MAG: cation:proton antiporter [Nanoarchaeota archaeon]|nr:cation:proton antiporter [Nanoarchaeota archaeon]
MEAIISSVISIILILLLGILISVIIDGYNKKKYLVSNTIVLLVLGIAFALMLSKNIFSLNIDRTSIAIFSTIALAIILFDSTFSLKLRELDSSYKKALLRFIIFFTANLVFLTYTSLFLFEKELNGSVYLAMILSTIMTAISPHLGLTNSDKFLSKNKEKIFKMSGRIADSIKTEAKIGLPIILLTAFIILSLAQMNNIDIFSKSFSLSYQLMIGISMGVLMAIIVIAVIRSSISENISSIILAISILVTYGISEYLGGNGIAAIITLGMFYSSIYIKSRKVILEHSAAAIFVLESCVFFLVALSINLNFEITFLIKSIILFAIYILIRFLVVTFLAMNRTKRDIKHVLFMTFQVPKDISIAAIILIFSNFYLPGMQNMLSIALYFVLLSQILSLIVTKNINYFLKEESFVRENIEHKIEKHLH